MIIDKSFYIIERFANTTAMTREQVWSWMIFCFVIQHRYWWWKPPQVVVCHGFRSCQGFQRKQFYAGSWNRWSQRQSGKDKIVKYPIVCKKCPKVLNFRKKGHEFWGKNLVYFCKIMFFWWNIVSLYHSMWISRWKIKCLEGGILHFRWKIVIFVVKNVK